MVHVYERLLQGHDAPRPQPNTGTYTLCATCRLAFELVPRIRHLDLTAVLVLAFAHARVPREGRAVVTAAGAELELTEVAQLSRLAENSPRAAAGFALEGGPL